MITNFKIFEKQLNLFQLDPTDTDIATDVIYRHKIKLPKINKSKTLRGELNKISDEKLDSIIKDAYNEFDSESNDWIDLISKNKNIFIDFIVKDKKKLKELEDDDNWYYHLDNYDVDIDDFITYLINTINLRQQANDEYYEELKSAIYDSEDPNRLQIFRAIKLPSNLEELENYDGIGVCWSYDFDFATAYCGSHNREFILEGWVYADNIDWYETIKRSFYQLREEKEITLLDNAPVQLTSVYMKTTYEELRNNTDEIERISKLFNLDLNKTDELLDKKYKNMTKLNLDDNFWVSA